MKRRWLVRTEYGDFTTYAVSPQKAVANVRWRIASGKRYALPDPSDWTVREVA